MQRPTYNGMVAALVSVLAWPFYALGYVVGFVVRVVTVAVTAVIVGYEEARNK